MPASTTTLSTADARRETVIRSAVTVFAGAGYLGTPTSAVAEHAGISTAYVFKLFPRKQDLFVAAFADCCDRIVAALDAGAAQAAGQTPDLSPDALLDAMGGAYAALIADRSLMMLQVHAQSAAAEPEIAAALRAGLAQIVEFVETRSGASDEAVQRFMAYGQLCHLITVAGLDGDPADWARLLAHGFRHY